MPPTGVDNWANELEIKITREIILNDESGHFDVFEAHRAIILKDWKDYLGVETNMESYLNYEKKRLYNYLKSVTHSKIHSRLFKALDQFDFISIGFFKIYDTGAEIIADELMVITPHSKYGEKQESVVIHISYMNS